MMNIAKTILVKIDGVAYHVSYKKQVIIPKIEYLISTKENVPGLDNGNFRFIWMGPAQVSYLDSDVIPAKEIELRNKISKAVLEDENNA